MRERHAVAGAPRFLRGVAKTVLVTSALGILLAIILWDADIYAARDRYEHFKLAVFGEWEPNWCPPGRETTQCAAQDSFVVALGDASDITFFRSAPIEGTDHEVMSGVRFANANDVVDGNPSFQWCYINIPQGQISQQLELATQSAGDPPIYAALEELSERALAGTGLRSDGLPQIARTLCQFQ